jgi:hypothetical protein
MLPIIPKPAISPRQKALVLGITGFVDLLQIGVFPAFGWGIFSPVQDAVDMLTAMILVAICGFKWQFVAGFMMELVPGLSLFPTWTAVALTLPTAGETTGTVPPTNASRPQAHQRINVEARVVPPVQRPPVQASR